MPYGSVLTDSITDSSGGVLAPSSSVFRNRIINGAMSISQGAAGATITPAVTSAYATNYPVDRFQVLVGAASKLTTAQSSVAPTGFNFSTLITSSSAYTVGSGEVFVIRQNIEGFNTADLGWGAAGAASITLSFWVRSSLTGTFGGSVQNSASNRSYPFTYSIASANTWEQKSVTIAGDTSGTWIGATNGIGLRVNFGLGVGSTYSGTAGAWAGSDFDSATGATSVVGTNGATFYITGVQLEKGSTATSFDYLDYGRSLAQCQRYLPCWNWGSGNDLIGIGYSYTTTNTFISVPFTVTPRVSPTGITVTGVSNMTLRNASNTGGTPTSLAINVTGSFSSGNIVANTTAGTPTIAAGQGAYLFATAAAQIQFTGCEL
jgi:hypothetical protein